MTTPGATFIARSASSRVAKDGTLLELARVAGLFLPSLCGGRGKCAKCQCHPRGPVTEPTPLELELLSRDELAGGVRLACQVRPLGEVEVAIEEEVLEKGGYTEVAITPEPFVRKAYVELPRPAPHDDLSDVERIRKTLETPLWAQPPVLRTLPAVLRDADFRVTVALWDRGAAGEELLSVEGGDTRGQAYGVAFDVGTTSVVGYLIDLFTGREIARSARLNGQQPWGADVISRATHALEARHGTADLQAAVIETLNQILADCCATVDPRQVYYATVVGNSLMHHLLLGITPATIAVSPYVAVSRDPLQVKASDLGLALPNAWVYFLPLIGAYVGADTLAVILATGLDMSDDICLAVDIGTNGEMALGSRERILACSAPAGPAFEGAEIRHGMRAATGAIDRVRIQQDVRVWTVGDVPPRGICGSGLIDAIDQMVRWGIVDAGGRLLPRPMLEGKVPPPILERVVGQDHAWEFVLSWQPRIVITQDDVRQLQLAKGTILCGVRILMDELGIDPSQISSVSLAGAFGNYVDKRSALGIGMLPSRIRTERIQGVGNAAGQGARMSLLSRSIRQRAEALARRVDYFELSKHPSFEDIFVESLAFPHPHSVLGRP
jgi:uncharacterized 2Fe-2S/4Fe-4S cluster protein (DUF4445 family)